MKLFFYILLFSFQAFARPEIVIPDHVEVSHREILNLGDVALVTGATEDLLQKIETLVIDTNAKELLLSQQLKSDQVLKKIRSAIQKDEILKSQNPTFKIPSNVKVEFSQNPISRAEIERKIKNFLATRCVDCEYKISIQSLPAIAETKWSLDFSQMATRGGFLLALREASGGQNKWISGTIRKYELTPVTTRLIQQGERIQAVDVRMEKTDVTYTKDGVLRVEDVHGQAVSRALPIGTPIWTNDLKREPATKIGQIVKVILGDDVLEVTTNMQAEESGFIGDQIKIRNLETKKVLTGLILEKGVVKLL
jgi:flagella basal body P-ring formation protein FlgA